MKKEKSVFVLKIYLSNFIKNYHKHNLILITEMNRKIIAATLILAISGGGYAQENTQPQTTEAYMVADAHLDTQWLWDIQTTINEYVWNTISQNLFLLKKYPEYIFNFEGGVKYAWMKEYYPEQYEEMKKFIEEGRWHIAGSSWEANDVLVPSVESLIRNIMLGQTFYRQEFGKEGTDIFLPDCFGFGWTLPTVSAHCGLIGFSSQKLGWRNHPFYGNEKYPFTIGLWQGIDGKQIMMAHGYDYGHQWDNEDLSKNRELENLAKCSPLNTVYRYYGTGDRGGSPTQGSVRSVVQGIHSDGPVKIISATSDRLYKEYLPFDEHSELPVFNGELLMDVHGTGCYTSQAAMKLYNRQNELLGDAAERAAVAAEWLGAADYPKHTLTESWRRFIFHQFHDDLTGTSIPGVYEFSWNDELISLKQFSQVLTASVNAIARQMDTRTKGTPILLYNSNAFPVSDLVEIELEHDKAPKGFSVYNAQGKKVASQILGNENGRTRLLIAATLPASGYAVYDIRNGNAEKTTTAAETSILENSVYKITLDKNGDIVSLIDKRNNKELVKEGKAIRLAIFTENKSYAWPAWEILKETIDREPVSITDNVKITWAENGALRKSLCIEKQYDKSLFRQYIRLYEGDLADRIDFYNEIGWQSTNRLLKAEFPLNIANENATYDLGIGSVERGNNTPTAYEVYAHQWADLTDRDNSYGVSILNDSKYGWDKPDDNTIRLTLLHTPKTDGRNHAYQDHQDFGYHTFTYSIVGHAGALDKPATAAKAEILNRPVKAFYTPKHAGALGKEFSFVRSDNDRVVIKALKKAEVSDEYVVRVYETEGKARQQASLIFAGEIEHAVSADGTEKEIGTADFDGNRLNLSIDPYSILTFKVKLKQKKAVQPLQYACLPLQYDRKCFSWNAFRHESDFESGNSYAAELLPDSILVADGIPFRLGEKELANGLTCKGNVLQLPAGHSYNRIYFLAAATDEDAIATFLAGKKAGKFTVPSYTGFIGQWGHTGQTESYLKEADIAYVGTHRHSSHKDEAYEFTYMFKFGMDIPKGATTVTLPDDRSIVLFAATLTDEKYPAVSPAFPLFRTAFESVKENMKKVNLLQSARLIGCSGEVNGKEVARYAIDGDPTTKWCDINPAPHYIEFDLGEARTIGEWKLINAGSERLEFITSDCFLQGKNTSDEEWKTIDMLNGNRKNKVTRRINPVSVRYVRLLVTQSTQNNDSKAARIYEFGVYE